MTLQKAKSIARHLGLTVRQLRSGNYRVAMETRPRPTTQTNSKTPLMPWLRWPVSERFQAIAELTDLVMTAAHSSGSDEQIFGPDSFRQDLGFLRAMTP